jgi:hypothetical protein
MATVYDRPASDDRGPLLIRPSWWAVGRWWVAIATVMTVGLLAGSLELFGKSEKLSWFAAMLGACGLLFAGYLLYLAAYMVGTRIKVTSDAILVTHWFWSTSRVDPGEVARVVRCSVLLPPTGRWRQLPAAVVFAFSASGRCVLSLYADRWRQADLDRIWRHLGVVPEGSWSDFIEDRSCARNSRARFEHSLCRSLLLAGRAVTLGGQWRSS